MDYLPETAAILPNVDESDSCFFKKEERATE